MKYYKIIFSLLIGVFSVLFIGCEEKVLDKTPKNTYSENDVWGDINLAAAYLNDAYDGVGKWGVDWDNPRNTPAGLTDNTMQRGNHGFWVYNTGDITPSSYGACNRWDWNYENIRICNVFLKRVDEIEDAAADEVNSLKAQARYIRANCYADLLNYYSWWEGENNGVPLIKEPFELDDDFAVERDSYDDVLNFIISELDAAKANLPTRAEQSDEDWGKPTKGACQALKAEQLLYAASSRHNGTEEDWIKARDASKAIIEMDQYSLVGENGCDDFMDYAQIWLDRGNSEIIFARSYHPQYVDDNWIDKMTGPNGFTGWGGDCPTQDLVDEFEMANGMMINEQNSGYDPENPYEGRSVRFYANIIYNGRQYRGREIEAYLPAEGSSVAPGIDSRASEIQRWNSSPTSYWHYKFHDESVDFKTTNSDVPLIIFRLGEVYLNYAEAEYHLGNTEIAREYVNKIRNRVNLPDIPASEFDMEDIRHERRLELAFENNHRFCDVRRWEILDETASKDAIRMAIYKDDDGSLTYEKKVAQERKFKPAMYNFPIPFEEMQKAPSLTQNPDY